MALRRPATTDVQVKETADTAEAVKETVIETPPKKEAVVEKEPVIDDAPPADDDGQDSEPEPDAAGTVEQQADAAPEVKEAESDPAPTQTVATQASSTAVAAPAEHRNAGAMKQFTNDMAEQGFEGLELTGQSFDRVKLHEATFQLGSDDADIGAVIHVQVLSTRNVYVVRQHSGQKSEVFYSYDPKGLLKSDGTSAADILEKWKEDGYGEEDWNIKTYLEAMAKLVNRDDEYNEAMVMLSIPPASRSRMAGAIAGGMAQFKTRIASDLLIECKVGKKIGSGDEAFRPWVINAKGLVEQE